MTIQNVPTTLFTGFFGVGKTTAIRSLLARKPASENWAILVNEFGEIAVDQAVLKNDTENSVTIREIPGGCRGRQCRDIAADRRRSARSFCESFSGLAKSRIRMPRRAYLSS